MASTIEQDIIAIRNAVYGKDVREAIADGLEHCYSDGESAITRANNAATAANTAAGTADTATINANNATSAANTAAGAANTAATNVATIIAPVFVEATPNDPGTYVTKDGVVYYLPDGHTENETWANTTKIATNIGAELNKLQEADSNLKSAMNAQINDINSRFDLPKNIFDKQTAILNKRFSTNGTVTDDGGAFLAYIPIVPGVYTTKVASGIYGSSGALKFHLFDQSKNLLETIIGVYVDEPNGIANVTVTNGNAVYLGWSQYKDDINTLMFVRGLSYPAEYIEYTEIFEIPNALIEKEQIKDFIAPKNLFDISTAISGKYFSPSTGEEKNDNTSFCAYIPVTGGIYITKVATSIFGVSNALKFNLFDTGKTKLATVTGEYVDSENAIAKVYVDAETYTSVKYVGWSQELALIDTVMFVEGDTYPSTYVPCTDKTIIPDLEISIDQIRNYGTINPLYGKTLVCDGDSICAASSVNGGIYRGFGWCGRIGKNNDMTWHNCGVGGGTIATGTNSSHNLSVYIDTIHTLYPTLDYLILEGGTNDADQDVPAGNPKISDYNIGDSETAYDTSTFYGALNMLFYKATKYYPRNKIGFIIAQKMGDDGSGYASDSNKRRQYFDMCIEMCIKWGIPYIDLWNMGQLVPRANVFYNRSMTSQQNWDNGYAYSDGQHLTNVGYDIITPKIEAWMKTL